MNRFLVGTSEVECCFQGEEKTDNSRWREHSEIVISQVAETMKRALDSRIHEMAGWGS